MEMLWSGDFAKLLLQASGESLIVRSLRFSGSIGAWQLAMPVSVFESYFTDTFHLVSRRLKGRNISGIYTFHIGFRPTHTRTRGLESNEEHKLPLLKQMRDGPEILSSFV